MKYKHLFSPLKLNTIILRNRIISAPMALTNGNYGISGTYYGGLNLHDISLGGTGLIVIPEANDDPKNGVLSKYQKEITREQINLIRQAGAKACCEVPFHAFPGIDGIIPAHTGTGRGNQRLVLLHRRRHLHWYVDVLRI